MYYTLIVGNHITKFMRYHNRNFLLSYVFLLMSTRKDALGIIKKYNVIWEGGLLIVSKPITKTQLNLIQKYDALIPRKKIIIKKTYMKLPHIKDIKKIGSFDVKTKVVIGDTDYSEIKLKKGTYYAYQIDDNLMVTQEEKIPSKKKLEDIRWVNRGESVGVDSGTFGFYDNYMIDKINEITKEKTKNQLPFFKFNFKKHKIMTGRDIEYFPKKHEFKEPIGVISDTGTGDGFFDCYLYGNTMAIMIGGHTANKFDL